MKTSEPLRIASKKALVTGGGGGIGAAIARMLARHGARVLVADINVAAAAGLGGLPVPVNNAGIAVLGSIESVSVSEWHRLFAVIPDSVFYGCKTDLRVMCASQPDSIVNFSSISGLIASHNFTDYNASNAAVGMVTKSVALHCARERLDIRCNSVHPAFVVTPMLDGLVARHATLPFILCLQSGTRGNRKAAADDVIGAQHALGENVAVTLMRARAEIGRFEAGAAAGRNRGSRAFPREYRTS